MGIGLGVARRVATLCSLPKTLLGTRLYANAFYLWANTMLATAAGFIFWIVAARIYRAHDVGLAAAAVASLMLLGAVANLGLGLALIRFLAEAGARRVRLLNGSFTLASLAAAAMAMVFLAGIPLWSPSLGFLREQPLTFGLYTVFAISYALRPIQTQAFVAMRRPELDLLATLGGAVTKLGLLMLLAVFLVPFGIVSASAAAPLAGLTMGFLWLLRRAEPTYRPAVILRGGPGPEMLSYSFGNYVSKLLLMTPDLIVPLVVLNRLGGEASAYFYVAWAMESVVETVSVSLSLSLFAEGSHYPDRLRATLWRSLRGGILVSALAALVFLVAADKLLLVFGADYAREGANLLRLLALGAVPACVTNIYVGVEQARKGIRRLVLVSTVVAAITLGASYWLLGAVGLEGAGIAWLAAQCAGAGLAAGLYFLERRRSQGESLPGSSRLAGE